MRTSTLSETPQITVAGAARRLGVSAACVRDWIEQGLIAGYRRSDGTLGVSASELRRARRALGFPEESRPLA